MQYTKSSHFHFPCLALACLLFFVHAPVQAGVHGCTFETATDLRGEAEVSLESWSNGHNQCVIVSLHTEVTWTGNFTAHPLVGGVVATADPTSPITLSNPDGSTTTVTFSLVGDYPYFCTAHESNMDGVIYVRADAVDDDVYEDGFEGDSSP
jgi:hypothetical protein